MFMRAVTHLYWEVSVGSLTIRDVFPPPDPDPEASPASERRGPDVSAPSGEQAPQPASGAEGDKRDRETDENPTESP
jgi:hypothetical protein